MMKIGTLALMLLGTVGTAAQAVVVTPSQGDVQITAAVDDGASLSDSLAVFSQWVNVPAPVTASASASITHSNGGSITAHGSISAAWASATSGTITARGLGWDFVNSPGGGAVLTSGGPNWSYTFTPTTDATYTLNYAVVGTGATFGLWGFYNSVNGSPDYAPLDVFSPTHSGTFTALLSGGQTYTVGLQTQANIGSGGDNSAAMDGDFTWSITGAGVPEPASWAMMISGFGLIGSTLRARRRAEA